MKFCNGCKEWWFADVEFFYKSIRQGGLQSQYKACCAEKRKLRRET